jgi:hypothetical protein
MGQKERWAIFLLLSRGRHSRPEAIHRRPWWIGGKQRGFMSPAGSGPADRLAWEQTRQLAPGLGQPCHGAKAGAFCCELNWQRCQGVPPRADWGIGGIIPTRAWLNSGFGSLARPMHSGARSRELPPQCSGRAFETKVFTRPCTNSGRVASPFWKLCSNNQSNRFRWCRTWCFLLLEALGFHTKRLSVACFTSLSKSLDLDRIPREVERT